jgi:serine O-acetyltransferase
MDHGTGVVIGETTVIGKNCSFLHGITLGGTGNSTEFDRHPKLGDRVFLGANVKILGNIIIDDEVKVGANSLVLKPMPKGAIVVGSPANIIGYIPKYLNINDKQTI